LSTTLVWWGGDEGVACVDEAMGDVDEAFHIGYVQADGGLLDEGEVGLSVLEAAEAVRPWGARLRGVFHGSSGLGRLEAKVQRHGSEEFAPKKGRKPSASACGAAIFRLFSNS